MYPGKEPDYPGLIKQGWIEFTSSTGEEALYHTLFNAGGTYVEVVRKQGDLWKAQEFPRHVVQNVSDEELANLLFENKDIEWSDYQGTLKLGDRPDKDQKHGEPPNTDDTSVVE